MDCCHSGQWLAKTFGESSPQALPPSLSLFYFFFPAETSLLSPDAHISAPLSVMDSCIWSSDGAWKLFAKTPVQPPKPPKYIADCGFQSCVFEHVTLFDWVCLENKKRYAMHFSIQTLVDFLRFLLQNILNRRLKH